MSLAGCRRDGLRGTSVYVEGLPNWADKTLIADNVIDNASYQELTAVDHMELKQLRKSQTSGIEMKGVIPMMKRLLD